MPAIAFLGLGAMGSGMARALLAAGYAVTVHNRTSAKADPLRDAGGTVATSAADAVRAAQTVVLSLADEAAVEQLVFGELTGKWRPGTVVVDTTTVSPGFSRETTRQLAEQNVRRVEACVMGNPEMAAAGRLRVLTAGDESDVDKVRDVLEAIGQDVRHLGSTGNASVLKLAFNLLLGVQTAGLAEAIAFVEAMGMDRNLLLDAFDTSGWRSPVLSFRANFMRKREYRPAAFRTALMHKDLRFAADEAGARGIELPLVDCASGRFAAGIDAGHGDDDAASVVELSRKTGEGPP
ncbi:NAD(P)-dependent oxidoreductase [Amycolatopsis circi]|uniref:NAD(P)-dependent oxidoreductase n=1 Tax=Amycolatopsis circi TaxID=871959 RepID=UPI001ABF7FB8|nr:NAD(P)-dependent oxidoreductase [Amycolatopsis circi]